jgi:tetratricopeptide (TPR) repeat protein
MGRIAVGGYRGLAAIILATALSAPGLAYAATRRPQGLPSGRQVQAAAAQLPFKPQPDDELTRAGLDRVYNMDYDAGIALLRQELQEHPDDPFAVNHLLAAVLAKELNREGALDAQLYTGNRFLKIQPQPVDVEAENEIHQLTARAIALTSEMLKKNPNDKEALFAQATARGYAATFTGVVEKHWFGALHQTLAAYHDDQRALQIDPNYADAKFIPGAYEYVVGNLSWYQKAILYLVASPGNKREGLQLLREAAAGNGEASMDARTFLALFLARDKKYAESISILDTMYSQFPGNFVYGFSAAQLLAANGQTGDAIAAYRKLVALGLQNRFPNSPAERSALALGELLRRQKQWQAAAGAFDEARKFPHADAVIVARAMLEAGEMFDLLGQRQEAIAHYNQVLQIAPGSDDARAASRRLKRPYESGDSH